MKAIRNILSAILLTTVVLMSASALAWPPEIAPELNFTNAEIRALWQQQSNRAFTANAKNIEYQKRFVDEVRARCGACTITEMWDKYYQRKFRVTLPNSWYFEITLDPGVIEITSRPLSEAQMAAMSSDLKNLIWDTAQAVGLDKTAPYPGHLNFGIESTFGNDALLFHNFIVDYLNQFDLVENTLGFTSRLNAPHPEQLSLEQGQALAKIFATFDPKKQTIQDLAKAIYRDVYYDSTVIKRGNFEPPEKYHAVNVSSIASARDPWPRLELRSLPMQDSPEELLMMSRLFTARIEHLKKMKTKIAYTASGRTRGDENSRVAEFHRYVTESGLDWGAYSRLLVRHNPSLQSAIEKFAKARALSCRQLF